MHLAARMIPSFPDRCLVTLPGLQGVYLKVTPHMMCQLQTETDPEMAAGQYVVLS